MAERIHRAVGMCSKSVGKYEALRAIQQGDPFIYGLTTRDGAVKIGLSRDVARRTNAIKYGGTSRLLAFRPGCEADEAAIHDRLAQYALPDEREYYYPTDEVIGVVCWLGEHFDLYRVTPEDFPDLSAIAC